MTDVDRRTRLLVERTELDADTAEWWLSEYRFAAAKAWEMLDNWLETGALSEEPLEDGHSLATLAEALSPLEAFALADQLLRAPRVGVRMVNRALLAVGAR